MATITKLNPSGSTTGMPVAVVAIATPGTTFHTASASAQDEVYMYLTNTDSVQRQVTIQFGGTALGQNIDVPVPANDTVLALPGIPITNSLVVAAFADSASKVNMFGYVNRIA